MEHTLQSSHGGVEVGRERKKEKGWAFIFWHHCPVGLKLPLKVFIRFPNAEENLHTEKRDTGT